MVDPTNIVTIPVRPRANPCWLVLASVAFVDVSCILNPSLGDHESPHCCMVAVAVAVAVVVVIVDGANRKQPWQPTRFVGVRSIVIRYMPRESPPPFHSMILYRPCSVPVPKDVPASFR